MMKKSVPRGKVMVVKLVGGLLASLLLLPSSAIAAPATVADITTAADSARPSGASFEHVLGLALSSRGTESAKRTYSSRPMRSGGFSVTYRVMRDAKGPFYLFATNGATPAIGMINMKMTEATVWTLSGPTADAQILSGPTTSAITAKDRAQLLKFDTAAGGVVCSIVASIVFGLIVSAVCPVSGPGLIACLGASGAAGHAVCSIEGGGMAQSAHWYPNVGDPGNTSGISRQEQCCGSPYYLIADYWFEARSCLPTDYSPGIKRQCHEINHTTGQQQSRQVAWRNTIYWPDNQVTTHYYTCTCTQLAPTMPARSVTVRRGATYGMAIEVTEGFDFIGYTGTGNLQRFYSLT